MDAELLPTLESPSTSIVIKDNAQHHNVEFDKKPNTASPRSYTRSFHSMK